HAPSGYSLQVRQDDRNVWHVVYGGFSRSSNLSLRAALAEATGVNRGAGWLATVERQVAAASGK
ncbi:MAG: hypothetical protein IRZ04_21485, partial [Rhodospirillales bacterium]|nr:hypothetical protein [Rhodospirillales bacterium]